MGKSHPCFYLLSGTILDSHSTSVSLKTSPKSNILPLLAVCLCELEDALPQMSSQSSFHQRFRLDRIGGSAYGAFNHFTSQMLWRPQVAVQLYLENTESLCTDLCRLMRLSAWRLAELCVGVPRNLQTFKRHVLLRFAFNWTEQLKMWTGNGEREQRIPELAQPLGSRLQTEPRSR